MSAPVFLDPDLPAVAAGGMVVLAGSEAHHASTVQRLRAGEAVEIVDGRGARVAGFVESASPRELRIRVLEHVREPAALPRITVVQAIPKGDRAEHAVELLTEVGVDVIIPWQAQNCVARWAGERGDRAHTKWVATARQATKQARRSWLPIVEAASTTAQICDKVRAAREHGAVVWLLHEGAEQRDPVIAESHDVWLIVGPEGGVSPEEVENLLGAGATPVRLGSTVFRTSTAGAVAAAVVSTLTGRWTNAHARMT